MPKRGSRNWWNLRNDKCKFDKIMKIKTKKYAAVLDFTPCIRTIKRSAKKQGVILNDKEAICLLVSVIKKVKYESN